MAGTIEAQRISKSFGGQQAVQNLSFSVPKGRIYGLLGPNGAGKTTTIRMLMDIIVPDSGTVILFGEPFRRDALSRAGYLPGERGRYKKVQTADILAHLAWSR